MNKMFFILATALAMAGCGQQRFMRVNRQFIISATAVQKLSTYFLGKMRIHMIAAPEEEIIVSKDKVATVKRWLDS